MDENAKRADELRLRLQDVSSYLDEFYRNALRDAFNNAGRRRLEMVNEHAARGIRRTEESFREATASAAVRQIFTALADEVGRLFREGLIPPEQAALDNLNYFVSRRVAEMRQVGVDEASSAGVLATMNIEGHFRLAKLNNSSRQAPQVAAGLYISGGTVGAINLGTVQTLEVQITTLGDQGRDDLAKAIKELAEFIRASDAIASAARRESLEYLTFLAEEAGRSSEARRPSVARVTAAALATVMGTSSDGLALWDKYGPLIAKALGW